MLPLVFGGVRDAAVVEHPGDSGLAVPLREQGEHLADNGGGLLVDEQMSLAVGVFLIAVKGERADVAAAFSAAREDAADVVRHIFEVPLVDQTVDLARLFVALVRGVGVVYDADEADAPDGEQAMDVLFDQLQLAGEAGLGLAEHDVELVRLGVRQKMVELGAAAVGAGIVIV